MVAWLQLQRYLYQYVYSETPGYLKYMVLKLLLLGHTFLVSNQPFFDFINFIFLFE